jgi:hypothetical protein
LFFYLSKAKGWFNQSSSVSLRETPPPREDKQPPFLASVTQSLSNGSNTKRALTCLPLAGDVA